MKLPRDIPAEFQQNWDAYLELPKVKKLVPKYPDVIAEGFRILMRQAGVRSVRLQKSVSSFITVNSHVKAIQRQLALSQVAANAIKTSEALTVSLVSDEHLNVVERAELAHTVLLKPQRFSTQHILDRMVELRVFKSLPVRLASTRSKPANIAQIRDTDLHDLYRDKETALQVGRMRNDNIALRTIVTIDSVFPLYNDTDKQVKAIWQKAIVGVFR